MTRPVGRLGDARAGRGMVGTRRVASGVGLAASKIGVGLRVFVFGSEASKRCPGEVAARR